MTPNKIEEFKTALNDNDCSELNVAVDVNAATDVNAAYDIINK